MTGPGTRSSGRPVGTVGEMPRYLWCRHLDCQKAYRSDAGKIPQICPECKRSAAWTTNPVSPPITPEGDLAFTESDQKFLRSMRILAS
jgi:hypothetical protein